MHINPAVQLTWQDIYNNEVGFKIERSVDGGAKWTHVWSAPPDITTWTDHGVGGSRRYYYRIQAYTNTGPGAYSNIASATTHSGSGIDFRNSPWEFPLDPSDARAQDRPEFLNGAPVPEIEGPPAPGVDYYPQIPWNSSVTYEAETGRMIVEPAQVGGSSFIDQITYGTSTIYDEDNASGSGASNDDGRQNAGDTTKPPWAAVCRLVVRTWGPVVGGLQFPDAEPGYASGVLISPRHLLTAAHVIIANPLASDPAARSSAFTIVAQPGRNGSINMYGSLSWKRYSILGNWLKTRESQYDMAIIELFDEPGLVTKHLGYAYLVGMNPGWPIVLSGYPGTSYNLPDVRYQYKAEGHVTLTEPFLFSDDLTLFHGDSGAPLWPDPWQTQTNGHHLVVGIHHGRLNNKPVEVRVSPSKKAQIDRWIQ